MVNFACIVLKINYQERQKFLNFYNWSPNALMQGLNPTPGIPMRREGPWFYQNLEALFSNYTHCQEAAQHGRGELLAEPDSPTKCTALVELFTFCTLGFSAINGNQKQTIELFEVEKI